MYYFTCLRQAGGATRRGGYFYPISIVFPSYFPLTISACPLPRAFPNQNP
jgi:hypothetical protein